MTTENLWAELDRLVTGADFRSLSGIIGALEAAKAAAWARLTAPPKQPATASPGTDADEMLTPEEAVAAIGGRVSTKWLYRHTKGLRFRRDLSRKVVRFERSGLMRWIAAKRT